MSTKPDIIPQVDVVEQIKSLTEQKTKLTVEIDHIENRMQLLQASIAENDHLIERVKTLTAESLQLFGQEWRHRADFFPDIWLGSLEHAVSTAEPKK